MSTIGVRREKALASAGEKSRPGAGSFHPVAIEAAAEATIAAHYKLDDEQQQILYQLHCRCRSDSSRSDPKCSENSAIA